MLTVYHQQSCRPCRFGDLDVVAEGTPRVLASVSWELLRAYGCVVRGWRKCDKLRRTDQD